MPEDPHTSRYRLLRGPWGIWIELTASAAVTAEPPARGERVSDGAWLDTTPVRTHPPTDRRGLRLSAEEADWLRHGASLAAPALASRAAGAHTLVTVHRVLFPEADFQPEGLAAALLQWAREALGLPPHPVEATFDRAANRYAYDWGPHAARPPASSWSSSTGGR
ncbi:hypothetical protein ACFWBF_16080 [Streptomyces sp. NPDC060028]|uniref:hypothetical protein n=1 Tax=Streptomyces sp. NPDC060028 TaxID=3347041 RepID=UPI00368D6932